VQKQKGQQTIEICELSFSRGDRTPIELFLAGFADWDGAAINRLAGMQK
jgi:hypothetical protein